MATVIVSLRIMPDSPDTDLDSIAAKATSMIKEFGGAVGKTDYNEVAFGLKSIDFMFSVNEARGGTEELEKKISMIEGVSSVEVTDVRRGIG